MSTNPGRLFLQSVELVAALSDRLNRAIERGEYSSMDRLALIKARAMMRGERRAARFSQLGCPFYIPYLLLETSPDGLRCECLLCGSASRHTHAAQPGPLATELFLHYLACSTGPVEREFVFAPDEWEPRRESFEKWSARVCQTFNESLEMHRNGVGV